MHQIKGTKTKSFMKLNNKTKLCSSCYTDGSVFNDEKQDSQQFHWYIKALTLHSSNSKNQQYLRSLKLNAWENIKNHQQKGFVCLKD